MDEADFDRRRDDLDAMRDQLRDLDDLAQRFGSTFTSAIATSIRSGRSFEDTLKSIALRMSNMALSAGLKPLQGLISNGIGSLAGSVTPFAKGGVVSSPTLFPLGSGAGLMGEAGAEAIMPLARGADGRLGVRGGAGGGGVNVTVNVQTPDAGSFVKSEAQVSASLARAVGRARRSL